MLTASSLYHRSYNFFLLASFVIGFFSGEREREVNIGQLSRTSFLYIFLVSRILERQDVFKGFSEQ